MVTYVLWSALVWTFKGLLFTWRFFWVSPYHAIKTSPRGPYGSGRGDASRLKHKLPLHKRLSAAEDDIQTLKNQLNSQRELWEKRFYKLQKRQQDLRNQLTSEAWLRSGIYLKQEGMQVPRELLFEAMLENGPQGQFVERDPDFPRTTLRRHEMMEFRAEQNSQMSSSACDSRPPSALSVNTNTSVSSWRSGSGPHRVFVPHSPMDLQVGHRVRVLLPSGRISTGTLRYLGPVDDGSLDYHLGVELERADNGSQTGVHQGQHHFDCMPGHGAFVTFQKLLMAWE
ncbi:hypothetical protein AALO_G00179610 [Alosa alosa]|uniref:CAP-Gly domain-containing protein n=1 Tax=Alosa alosa TaxID=278164 RepID=A0AAV6G903_9TELE|nr:uncharacterized protein LOC125306075 [Alosa alosa]XP_048117185.1 uncharacterized protein LOC125306075 [Alosa alosa]KAG5271425.1 hypothetical protein AALO_G00179610 [Alosa alosa]